jgi:hypothetical protein
MEDFGFQYLWLLNLMPIAGVNVHMRMNINVSLDAIQLVGKDKDCDFVRKKGYANLDVLEWKVLTVKRYETSEGLPNPPFQHVRNGVLGQVVLSAVTYMHTIKSVQVFLNAPVVTTFKNVPMLKTPLSYRKLYVIKCGCICMHCNQRSRRWQSVDATQPNHRSLCSVCMDHLYVNENQLERKYKCKIKKKNLEILKTHFVECYYGAVTNILSKKPLVMVLKSDLASFWGYESWTEFLSKNYQRQLKHRERQRESSRFYEKLVWW